MGLSTFAVGLLPSYAAAGVAAPILLVALRLLQGLALGGEYGGAATYVAEHAPAGPARLLHQLHPDHRDAGPVRGPAGGHRRSAPALGEAAFAAWGWRIPFLVSILLLAVSLWIRHEAGGKPGLPADEGGGQGLQGAADRSLRALVEPQDRPDRPVRRGRGPGGGLVCRPVLRAFLSRADAQGRRRHRQHIDRDRARAGDALLHPVRLAVGPDRPQADHPRRLRARRSHLFPLVRGARPGRQSGALRRHRFRAGARRRRSRRLLGPVRPDRPQQVRRAVVRHRQDPSSPARASATSMWTGRRAAAAQLEIGGVALAAPDPRARCGGPDRAAAIDAFQDRGARLP